MITMNTISELTQQTVPIDSIWHYKGVRWRVVHVVPDCVKLETCHKKPGSQEPAGKLRVKVTTLLSRYQRLS